MNQIFIIQSQYKYLLYFKIQLVIKKRFLILVSILFLILPALTFIKGQVNTPLRRTISPSSPMWIVHIDTWLYPDPQKCIDQIPEDIKPYVVFNISLSTQTFVSNKYPFSIAESWLRTCAQNKVFATIQPSAGYGNNFSNTDLTEYEYFFQKYPNFLGYNFAEQCWAFPSNVEWLERIDLFRRLLILSDQYGGYLTVSVTQTMNTPQNNPIGMMKLDANFAAASKTYKKNFILMEKYTTSRGFYDCESVCLGAWLEGHSGHYGLRMDHSGWNYQNAKGVNFPAYPESSGLSPLIEHFMLTGETITDGPEITYDQTLYAVAGATTPDGFTYRRIAAKPQFENISMDFLRKVIDKTIIIPSREEVIARTKIAIVNDISSGTNLEKYSTPQSLFTGLYAIDGEYDTNNTWFKKSGRYPTIPTLYSSGTYETEGFTTVVNKSQYASRWTTQQSKVNEFNTLFPAEYTGDMYVGRHNNGWITYNPFIDSTLTRLAKASIPLKYNTCDSVAISFPPYDVGIITESTNSLQIYLNNYCTATRYSGIARTDTIKIFGSTSLPTYTLTERGTHAASTVTTSWSNNVFKLAVTHNGPLDLTINCSGNASSRLTPPALPVITAPAYAPVYTGERTYEAENFDYKSIYTVGGSNQTSIPLYQAMGYFSFGTSASAAIRDTVTVLNAGTFQLKTRYSTSAGNVTTVDLYVNGTKVATPTFAQTATDSAWTLNTQTIHLNEGKNVIMFKANAAATTNIYFDNIVLKSIFGIATSVSAGGTITKSGTSVLSGDTVWLDRDSIATFVITPAEGYVVSSLMYNGVEVKSEITSGLFTTPAISNDVNLVAVFMHTSQPTDYFRSKISGNSNNANIWESSGDNLNWIASSLAPTSSAAGVTIQNGDTVAINNNQTYSNFTLNSGAVVNIAAGTQFTVTTSMTNNGTLQLLSDVFNTATILTPTSISGSGITNVQQYLTSGRNWYVASPVNNATSAVFNPAASENKLYWYDEAHGTTAPWVLVSDNSTAIIPMKGYIANVANNGIVTFTGTLNTGEKSITINRTSGQTKEGFNLVGNPYSSYLNWDNVTKLQVQSTFWCRTTKLVQGLSSENAFLRLEISNGVNTDKTLIYSNTNASDNFDSYDTPKMFNDDPLYPEVFTITGTEQLAMNGLSSMPYNLEIPIGIKIDALTENTYTIKVNGFNNLLANTKIIIKDYQNPQSVISRDITNGSPYTFTSGFVNTTTRFTITIENINMVYVFDTYNATGQIAIDNSGNGINNKIPPMQAFWVRVDNAQTNGTLTMDNSMRSHKDNNDPVLKTKSSSNSAQSVLRLQVSNGLNIDETVIYTNPMALNTFDDFDSEKMFNNSNTIAEIFTVADTKKLAINGLKALEYNTEIPLGFTTLTANTFSISANQILNFEAGTKVILLDKQIPAIENDLTNGKSYYFSAGVTPAATERFSLIFRTSNTLSGTTTSSNNRVSVFVNSSNQITIIAPEKSSYAIYNVMGQLVESGLVNLKYETQNKKNGAGVYFVTISHNGLREIQKVIIR